MIFTPRPIQNGIITAITHEYQPRYNVWASMGTGKTGASIYAYDMLRMFGEAKRLLVIGPKRVIKNTWPREFEKWKESFGHLSVAVMSGTEDQRIAAARSGADVTTINYDLLPWLCERAGAQWPWDMVIADESTRLKGLRISERISTKGKVFETGQGSVRAKAVAKMARQFVRRWVNLTGSPAPNGLQDLWGQQFFIDRGARLGTTFTAYQRRYFHQFEDKEGRLRVEAHPWAQKQIEALLRDCTVAIKAEDWFPLDKTIERIVYIDLPPSVRKRYEQVQKEFFTELESGERIDVFNASSKMNKCLQFACGSVYFDDAGNWAPVHDEKIDALRSIVEETNGEPLLVRYTYRPDCARILKEFPQAVFFDDSRETEDRWNRGDIPMMVTHAASAGHGSNLQDGGRILVDYGQDWSLEQDEQIIERLGPLRQFQSGHPRSVFRYRIVAKGTLEDRVVLPTVRRKMTLQDALTNAMKNA